MKKLLMACALAGAALVAACTAGQTIPTATFNDKVAIAVQSATTTRKVATELMLADKISLESEGNIQNTLNTAMFTLKSAKAIERSDPAKAGALLAQALAQLEAAKAETAKVK